jgi:hypothetical protein
MKLQYRRIQIKPTETEIHSGCQCHTAICTSCLKKIVVDDSEPFPCYIYIKLTGAHLKPRQWLSVFCVHWIERNNYATKITIQ